MTNNSDALQRIEVYFEEFCEGVRNCLSAELFVRRDLLNAYSGLSRLRDRFRKDKHDLSASALAALSKVFENDPFIKGMMEIRQVAEHTKKGGEILVLYTTDNVPVTLDVEVSAMPMFSGYRVTLADVAGSPFQLDHLRMLREAERRITKAMSKTPT